ncbi:MAG: FHA domain-containing protein [Myxococcota bacterium]|nr:FHA domain-containing protein [Myxococcota bacterium]MDW8361692.1 FHA domain-containing protein [Myxococcales bacterium]
MIRFRQTFGAHAGRVLEFDRQYVRFGRLPECEVAFDPNVDLDASGKHAEMRFDAGRYWLVDAGSRNGLWVNGKRVTHKVLEHGDEIEFGLGGPRLRVEIPGLDAPSANPPASAATSPVDPFARTLVAMEAIPAEPRTAPASSPMPKSSPAPPPSLRPPPSAEPVAHTSQRRTRPATWLVLFGILALLLGCVLAVIAAWLLEN